MKTIFITGASSGIGKSSAQLFQSKGWNVIATMRNPEDGKLFANLDSVLVERLDVLDSQSIQLAVEAGVKQFGKIDVLLNNAGYGTCGPLEAATSDIIKRQFDVNVIGLLEVTKAILPHFRKQQSGILINVSSVGGKVSFPLGSLYNGTKFAIEGISESLQHELSLIGCKVKVIEPGVVATDFAGRSFTFYNNENLTEYQRLLPLIFKFFEESGRKALLPDQVAALIYTAATDGSDQLRYVIGNDAQDLIGQRQTLSDGEFTKTIKNKFGIVP